ncbi:UNVERIFIED_ORG: hypothetical protein BDU10_6857 [Burkholderia sp. CF145]|nr:hypothetical protein PMI06_000883 [Burkholderia sp. BT03]SKD07794.1 hypothetical protein SAMN06266956_10188 [Paraburkholderia hospita]
MDEDVPMEPLFNKPVIRVATRCLSIVDCCRADNMANAFGMLPAFVPPE